MAPKNPDRYPDCLDQIRVEPDEDGGCRLVVPSLADLRGENLGNMTSGGLYYVRELDRLLREHDVDSANTHFDVPASQVPFDQAKREGDVYIGRLPSTGSGYRSANIVGSGDATVAQLIRFHGFNGEGVSMGRRWILRENATRMVNEKRKRLGAIERGELLAQHPEFGPLLIERMTGSALPIDRRSFSIVGEGPHFVTAERTFSIPLPEGFRFSAYWADFSSNRQKRSAQAAFWSTAFAPAIDRAEDCLRRAFLDGSFTKEGPPPRTLKDLPVYAFDGRSYEFKFSFQPGQTPWGVGLCNGAEITTDWSMKASGQGRDLEITFSMRGRLLFTSAGDLNGPEVCLGSIAPPPPLPIFHSVRLERNPGTGYVPLTGGRLGAEIRSYSPQTLDAVADDDLPDGFTREKMRQRFDQFRRWLAEFEASRSEDGDGF